MVIRLNRLGINVSRVGGPLAGVLLGWTGAGPLHAQVPTTTPPASVQPTAPDTQRSYLSKNDIRLPIQIHDSVRSSLQEVQLYIKEHRNSPWVLRDKVAPTQKSFTVHLPKDGEYAFTMVTVTKKGQREPEDLRNEPPGLVVVIDTQSPQLELTNLGHTPEGQMIQFDVKDANLDNGRTRFAFQGGDRVFRNLEPMPGRSNIYCIPKEAVFTGLIRASAEDLAGNTTVFEEHLSKVAGHSPVVENKTPAPAVAQAPTQTPLLIQPPLPELVKPVATAEVPSQPAVKPVATTEVPSQLPPSVSGAPPIVPMTPAVEPKHVTAHPSTDDGRLPAQVQQTTHTAEVKRQVVNNPKLFLDYQLENVGPSGVGKLQVWITRDHSRTWTMLTETTHHGRPVEIQLPGESLFGVTLVAVNGRGVAAAPPAAGDTPDWWIEVDTTKPTVEISKIVAVPENGQHVVHIHWTAQDKNFGDGPVELLYSATTQGPWLPIAKGLKAEGQHRWTPPVDIGTQAFVRVIVRDAAGNSTTVNTLEPVLIGDQSRPRAVIRSISTTAPGSVPVMPVETVMPK